MSDSVTCDVLVAGSGAGGFAAALSARHCGLDVLMVEKASQFGGTTAYSAGVVWIPGNAHAHRAGMADDRPEALTYLEHIVGNRLDHARAKAFVDRAAEMLDFIEAHTHARYALAPTWADYEPDLPGGSQGGRSLVPEPFDGRRLGPRFADLRPPISSMMLLGGMMVGRNDIPHLFAMTKSPTSALHVAGMVARYARDRIGHRRGTRLTNGNGLIAALALTAQERGIPLWLSAPVVRLQTEAGRITGAVVQRDGRDVTVRARKGVVLACGGFPGSEALTAKYYPHVAAGKGHRSLPPETNSGDGARLGESVGALFQADVHQPAAWTPVSLLPQPDGSTVPFPHFIDRGKPGVIAVDRRGRRFANEAKSYHYFVPLMIEACRNDERAECWLIADSRAVRRFGLGAAPPLPGRLSPYLRSGYLARGETLEALARQIGIDAAGLADTVTTFNRNAGLGEDPQFRKGSDAYQRFNGAAGHKPNPCLAPLDEPPFYAVRLIPGELGTFAGLKTDAQGRALDKEGRPIAGLFAVGNDAASVMGGTYPGAGITIGPAMTFGYIAGRTLAGRD